MQYTQPLHLTAEVTFFIVTKKLLINKLYLYLNT